MIEPACADFCVFALPQRLGLRLPVTALRPRQIRFMIGMLLGLGFFNCIEEGRQSANHHD
jgi:hypothetical protein